jgi:ABC-2 type transport system ATP-binding protein
MQSADAPAAQPGADSGAAVSLSHVSKTFADTTALKDVSLEIQPGQFIALLGPNGAGKTTAINIMLGMRRPTAGQARLFGLAPQDLRARSRCGVMLQESGLPLTLRVREIVDQFRSYYPHPLATADVLERCGLTDKARAPFLTLSGGQRQRLYLGLALCGDAELLFLDEPTVGLDVEARHDFWQQLRDSSARGKTILLTTHYLEEADALARRIIVIDHGRIIADDTPAALKSRTASKRVSFELSAEPAPSLFAGMQLSKLATDGNRVSLITPAPEALLQSLFSRGYELRNLEVAGTTLEEAFLSLTGER